MKDWIVQGNWQHVDTDKFWSEISHPDHLVQIYDSDNEFLDNLVVFATAGFKARESVVVIATGDHIRQLDARLKNTGHDVFGLRLRDQYVTLDATEALHEFLINGSPDAILFRLLASNLIKRAKRAGRQVRAFGEMVAILWAQGNTGGTLCLEQLWSEYMEDESFTLFCAYPASGFEGKNASLGIGDVCKSHSHHVAPSPETGMIQFRRTVTSNGV